MKPSRGFAGLVELLAAVLTLCGHFFASLD